MAGSCGARSFVAGAGVGLGRPLQGSAARLSPRREGCLSCSAPLHKPRAVSDAGGAAASGDR